MERARKREPHPQAPINGAAQAAGGRGFGATCA